MSILSESKLPLKAHPPYGLRKGIEAVKTEVTIVQYLRDRGVEVSRNRARCLAHDGDNPQSFAVYPDEGRWHCFRCNEGGDVIDLCRAVEGGEPWEAMMSLAMRFGVDLPNTRTETWHTHQGDKAKIRDAAEKYIAAVYQRRLTRVYAPFVLVGGESPEEEIQELEGLASALWPICLDMAGRRVSSEE